MKGNNQGTVTPTPPASGRCLLHSSTLLEILTKAKQERATNGKGNAYAELQEAFHREVLPAFFIETQGNLSEVARLLGIHRHTISGYCKQADIDMTGATGKVGAA
ncbi:helix-turn-helix domain-containing protein [Thiothrix nivea]|uniref:Uncharacterized protein n=1 Tax=Thiothrix nivea (strain ATCC 35100 / DSM 5205 / JP2) TaxID=870187 RepID=A0A656HAN9_THINJ|nr:helix-turn-helix domain-containing protein [Thiothrix nivea]EIJ33367.1 hypothetical protein Thini_0730 [Thiothrix nivea DSM 5205]